MKRLLFLTGLTLLSSVSQLEARNCRCETETFDVYVGAGYRCDEIHLGDSDRTLFISDVVRKEFNNLEMVPFFLKAQYRNPCNFYANAYVSYAKTYDGQFRQNGFINVANLININDIIIGNATRQEAFDASGALGWQFHFLCDFFRFVPMVGYANYQQNIWADHFELQAGTLDFEPCDASQNLKAYWRGPWVGFSTTSGPYWCNWFLNFGYDYTFAFYSDSNHEIFDLADGTTVEIDTTFLVKNRSHGYGNHAWLGLEYHCEPRWSIGIFSDWRWFHARPGTSTTKYTLPQTPFEICGRGRFDGSDWNSWSIYIMLGYHWF